MEMSEIYNGSQWAHDILLVNKARATEYIMGRSSTLKSILLNTFYFYPDLRQLYSVTMFIFISETHSRLRYKKSIMDNFVLFFINCRVSVGTYERYYLALQSL